MPAPEEAVRKALAARETAGLPYLIQDPAVLEAIAAILRQPDEAS